MLTRLSSNNDKKTKVVVRCFVLSGQWVCVGCRRWTPKSLVFLIQVLCECLKSWSFQTKSSILMPSNMLTSAVWMCGWMTICLNTNFAPFLLSQHLVFGSMHSFLSPLHMQWNIMTSPDICAIPWQIMESASCFLSIAQRTQQKITSQYP